VTDTTVDVVSVGVATEAVVVVGVTIVDVAAPLACTSSVPVAAIGAVDDVPVDAVVAMLVSVDADDEAGPDVSIVSAAVVLSSRAQAARKTATRTIPNLRIVQNPPRQ